MSGLLLGLYCDRVVRGRELKIADIFWGLMKNGRAETAAFGTQSAFVPSGGLRVPGKAEKGLQEIGVGAEVRVQEMWQSCQRRKESL